MNAFLTAHNYDPLVTAILMVLFVTFVAAMGFDLVHFPSRFK